MKTVAIAIIVLTVPLSAQWLTQPTAGIPRSADGKPDLAARTPRTPDGKPDFSGIWTTTSRTVLAELQPVQDWVDPLVRQRREALNKDNMTILCLPLGPRYIAAAAADVNIAGMTKVVQTPTLIVTLNPDLTYRQIFLDGRALETDPNPSWMGYSVGRWEGDTLVVESAGFNDRTWLNNNYPHTEALRIIERYRRPDFGHLELEVTLDDPTLYANPFRAMATAELTADTELLEYVCNENTRSREHMVGTLSDALRSEVKIDANILRRYTGTYVEQMPFWIDSGVQRIFEITLSEGALFLAQKAPTGGPGNTRLVPQSETIFINGGLRLEFVNDSRGMPTHFLDSHVSGDYKFERTK
jgi:hypothetical protein